MRIAIDATNIKAGGGMTHLVSLVNNFDSSSDNLTLIGGSWIDIIESSNSVKKNLLKSEFNSLLSQEFFKYFKLGKYLSKSDISFIPGGTFFSKKIKYVSMSQNMLVFEEKERRRFPISFTRLRYLILEVLQVRSFKNACGIIYISDYARRYIENKYPELKRKESIVIYHGISEGFRQKPKIQESIQNYTLDSPFKLVYVSVINFYKHQWNVIEAVKQLRDKGYNIVLELIGSLYPPLKKRFEMALMGNEDFVFYRGKIPYKEIAQSYKEADMFIFASTCENMPNILVEAMSAGLPILSSNYGPMPEILKDGGVYMDPTNVNSIVVNLEKTLLDVELRQKIANRAYLYSQEFSWEETARRTFGFIKKLYRDSQL